MFELAPLPYAYDALEPYIDARTMELHHNKHHQAYVNNLNAALAGHPKLQHHTLEQLLTDLGDLPESIKDAVKNNAGGHYNHTLFWDWMCHGGGEPQGTVLDAIKKKFGSFEAFKEEFSHTAKTQFGSGWAWLVFNTAGDLTITSSGDQDTPFSEGHAPILGIDVWEHAYYLKYQNRRVDYIAAWWEVVNWDRVEELYVQHKG